MEFFSRYPTRARLFEETMEAFVGLLYSSVGPGIVPPVSVEQIATDLLGYQVLTDDLRYLGETYQGALFPNERRIIIDSSCNKQRWRFVLAHEIGHICLEYSPLDTGTIFAGGYTTHGIRWDGLITAHLPRSKESRVNRFAGALLAPRQTLISRLLQFSTIDEAAIGPLAEEFEVSPSVMCYRLLALARDNLLYRESEKGLPFPLPFSISALRQFAHGAREVAQVWAPDRPPPIDPYKVTKAFSDQEAETELPERPRLGGSSPKETKQLLAPLSHISSETELIEFITSLGDRNRVGVVLGGKLHLTIEDKRLLDDIKAKKEVVVVICSNQDQAAFARALSRVDQTVVYHGRTRNGVAVMPPAVHHYTVALAELDRWTPDRLRWRIENKDTLFPRIEGRKKDVPCRPYRQSSLFCRKRLNINVDARRVIKNAQKNGMKTVLVTGSFDLLHVGHVSFLQRAKRHNEMLVVGVEDDRRVRQFKGALINNVEIRCEMLSALSCVGFVFVISGSPKLSETEFYKSLCRQLKPDFRAIPENEDRQYLVEQQRTQIEAAGGSLRVVGVPRYLDSHSTTNDFFRVLLSKPEELKVWRIAKTLGRWQKNKGNGFLDYSKLVATAYEKHPSTIPIPARAAKQLKLFQDEG